MSTCIRLQEWIERCGPLILIDGHCAAQDRDFLCFGDSPDHRDTFYYIVNVVVWLGMETVF